MQNLLSKETCNDDIVIFVNVKAKAMFLCLVFLIALFKTLFFVFLSGESQINDNRNILKIMIFQLSIYMSPSIRMKKLLNPSFMVELSLDPIPINFEKINELCFKGK